GSAPVHAAPWGLGGAPVVGTLLAVPAITDGDARAALDDLWRALPEGDLGGVTTVAAGGALACRYVGGSVERARSFLIGAWRLLRPALLGRQPVPPRIWAT